MQINTGPTEGTRKNWKQAEEKSRGKISRYKECSVSGGGDRCMLNLDIWRYCVTSFSILRSSEDLLCVQKSQSCPIPSQMNPIHTLQFNFFTTHFDIILQFNPGS
jgi:hypothetical protein